jgi:tetratricopeptide (TPR) repeat protein
MNQTFTLTLLLWPIATHAQFVYPSAKDHEHKPGLYQEDPYIVHYRKEFFSVFQGDYPRFLKAFHEIELQAKENPRDARAIVWLGNGQTILSGVLLAQGKQAQALSLLEESRKTMDRAVALRPNDPNIYMMQAATLFTQGQYWPGKHVPRAVWDELRDDCLKFQKFLGPRIKGVSLHVRGESFGELGVAYKNLGQWDKAKSAFEAIVKSDPGTDYALQAQRELTLLAKNHAKNPVVLKKPGHS